MALNVTDIKFDQFLCSRFNCKYRVKQVEMPGIEPGAFHMQSERSTTELHPLHTSKSVKHLFVHNKQQGNCSFL